MLSQAANCIARKRAIYLRCSRCEQDAAVKSASRPLNDSEQLARYLQTSDARVWPTGKLCAESQVDKSTFMAAAYAAGGCIRVRVAAARIDARAID